ncbi:MAG TPA: histidine--tRNA ligase, partial [Phaeodactylibacter sp.]|nr:histidine--tRNA ligase [Phaeodactylibacter sp.]
ILTGYLKELGVEEDLVEQNIIRVIDKMDKIGLENVRLELGGGRTDSSGAAVKGLGLDEKLVSSVVGFIQDFLIQKTRKEVLADLRKMNIQNEMAQEGIAEMEKIDGILSALDFGEDRVIFDPSLVRGLAYYTGPVYEVESLQTYVDAKGVERRIGSICGGGRYDGLVENLLGMKVPATGASIGVDRLAELLILTNQVPKRKDGPVLIAFFDEALSLDYQRIARNLRSEGIETEVYYGYNKGFRKMKKQMTYADEKNCPFVILIGENEKEKGVATVKNLKLGKELSSSISDKKEWNARVQKEVPIAELVAYLKGEMGRI